MALFESLFVWANLPFAIAFTVAILFSLLQMTGVLGLLAGDSDHDADHDADVDADHDVDADADHDVDHDADHDAEHETHSSLGGRFLVDLGVGRVPFSILWQTFAIGFGLVGLCLNTLVLSPRGLLSAGSLAITIPVALFLAWLVTRAASRLLGKVVGSNDSEATSRHGLIGSTGTVISSRITSDFGEIRAKDKAGHFVHVVCRIRDDEAPIAQGAEVVIVDYDAEKGHLYVAPFDADLQIAPKKEAKKRIGENTSQAELEAAAEAEAEELANKPNAQKKSVS